MEIIIALIICVFFYYSFNSRLSSIEQEIFTIKKGKKSVSEVSSESSSVTAETNPYIYPSTLSYEKVQEKISVNPSNTLNEQTGGKILAIVGVGAVFLGFAFFLKFAFDNNLISIMGRIILGYSVGILAIILGVSLRSRYKDYADTLTGGGIAGLYLVTFAAYDFYHLFSDISAYILLVMITVFACLVAVYLSSEALVGLAFIGAFAAPFVMSLYQLDMFPLLGYLLILSLGNASIAYWYKWSRLNLIGIIGTFLLVNTWYNFGSPLGNDKVLVFLFVSFYFIIFLISTVMHHVIRKQISDSTDALALALNGFFYAGIGYELLQPIYPDAMGYFMFVVAIIYFFAALISFETNPEDSVMNAVLPAISAFFVTIAIPIHFHGSAITVAWFVEALLMFIIAYSVRGKNLYVYGAAVYVVGLVNLFSFHSGLVQPLSTFMPIFNERFLLFAFAVISGYSMSYISSLESRRGTNENAEGVKIMMDIISEVVGLFALTFEISTYFDKEALLTAGENLTNAQNTAVSIGWVIYASILTAIGFAGRYKTLRISGLILFFVTAFKIFVDLWAFGPLYRIVASIVFGAVALIASFGYSKFKDRISL